MAYHGQKILSEPAHPTRALWRLGVGVLMLAVGFVGLLFFYGWAAQMLLPGETYRAISREMDSATTPRSVLVMLANFIPMLLALWVTVRLWHGRGLRSLIGPMPLFFKDFIRVLLVVVVIAAVMMVLPGPHTPSRNDAMPWGLWLSYLPFALVLLLIQVGTEELVFRGYIQSQLAARVRSVWLWLILPSALFGVLHYDPYGYGANAWLVALWAGVFGMIAGDLTACAGNLGPALAVHFVNNFMVMAIVAPRGALSGLALYLWPFGNEDVAAVRAILPVDLAFVLCCWLGARVMIRR